MTENQDQQPTREQCPATDGTETLRCIIRNPNHLGNHEFPDTRTEHVTTVETVRGRYPYRPVCTCGHAFRGYVRRDAAETIADAHQQETGS